ncbi:MAG: NIPSNAP family protein [Pseudomonadales bacterium]|nr:NIPSNAP family protein [Pseudomonadales bacterium]
MNTFKQLSSRLGIAFISAVLATALLGASVQAQESGKVFELRTYKATPGNLDKLLARFRDHTLRIFEKHGMTNVAYWVPTDAPDSADTLVYLLSHESREAANASWRAFSQDPEWAKVNEESNANGPILDSVVRQYLSTTDFSPNK